jgi:hypothetical protein
MQSGHTAKYNPFILTNQGAEVLAFPAHEARPVLYDLSVCGKWYAEVDNYRTLYANSLAVVADQRDLIRGKDGIIEANKKKTDAQLKDSRMTTLIAASIIGVAGLLVGGGVGIYLGSRLK